MINKTRSVIDLADVVIVGVLMSTKCCITDLCNLLLTAIWWGISEVSLLHL